jgi:Abi-like protein
MKHFQSEQALLELLNGRGLLLTETVDSVRALRYLKLDGYYRLSGYFWLFYDETILPEHIFIKGTTWDDILHIYHADKDLKRLLLNALTEIEISMKSILVNTVCETIRCKLTIFLLLVYPFHPLSIQRFTLDDPHWCWNENYFKKNTFRHIEPKLCKACNLSEPNKSPDFLRSFLQNNPKQKPYVWIVMQEVY